MSQHTPEPWESKNGADGYCHITKGTTSIASFVLPNNAKRIVQCVNACAGIEDPAKEIADLRAQLDEAVKELEELKSKQPKIIMEVDGKTIATFFGKATLTQIKGGADDTK